MFTPFTKLKANVSRPIAGAGLGLPLTKVLVELPGGSLAIETAFGTGTTVRGTFPTTPTVLPTPAPIAADTDPG